MKIWYTYKHYHDDSKKTKLFVKANKSELWIRETEFVCLQVEKECISIEAEPKIVVRVWPTSKSVSDS